MTVDMTNCNRGRSRARSKVIVVIAAATLGVTGCSAIGDMEFVQDKRLEITAPENLSTVSLPVSVSWTMQDFTATTTGPATNDSGEYAVFVNQYPMAIGEDLHAVVDSNPGCRSNDGCLQPEFLATQFGVYLTTDTTITLDRMFDGPAATSDAQFITLVLVDTDGKRIGESVWYTSFRLEDQ